MAELLRVEGLAKRFGGIVATDDLTLSIPEGELHAVIGPNGAGKTTLIAQLSGQLAPDSGRIHFAGNDITDAVDAIAQPARPGALVSDHLAVPRSQRCSTMWHWPLQAHAGHSFHFWRNARREPELRDPARAALARVGLSARADLPASALSHGEHRQLELAMALASQTSHASARRANGGSGPEESARMVSMLRDLKKELTILLVEHDMEAVFALADRITVLVYGRVIASGRPDDIRNNAAGARRLSRRAGGCSWLTACLEVDGIETCYGPAARCCSASRSPSRPARWSR